MNSFCLLVLVFFNMSLYTDILLIIFSFAVMTEIKEVTYQVNAQ